MVNCGAAMFIAPVGAVNACDPQAAYNEAIAFASSGLVADDETRSAEITRLRQGLTLLSNR